MMMSFEFGFRGLIERSRSEARASTDRNLLNKPKYNLNVHLNRNECPACTAIHRDNVSCPDDGAGKALWKRKRGDKENALQLNGFWRFDYQPAQLKC